ncbi:hypothetical protein F4815DRAFT_489826 [Daldinia loculata]|nr:hypothetical protein F4815DRAFT_489826 [Daldinia loculata]
MASETFKFETSSDIHENLDTLSEPLLDTHDSSKLKTKPKRLRRWGLYVFHIFLFTMNTVLATVFMRKIMLYDDRLSLHAHSPARSTVEYETTYFEKYGHLSSPFSKKPGPELDAAWHKQLSGMNIRVSKDWLEPFDAESIHFADGSGVLAQLGVYHELHCLKKLKHWIYRSDYYGNMSAIELEEEEAHIEHCLEWLRVAALCRGDTTLTTFQWRKGERVSLETEYPIPRQCVNSERLLKWSEERAVDINQEGLLERA